MKTVLGISAFYHDSAAALVRDGEIVAAAQEERFSRQKHDPRFPRLAINYCLEEAFIEPDELDLVVFYDNPLLTLDRVMKTLMHISPRGEKQWLRAAPSVLGAKLFVESIVRSTLRVDVPVLATQHHLSHAASAFFPSSFKEAAILTIDGVGEWATTTIGFGHDSEIQILEEIHFPHSLGLLYSTFTFFCGFKVNSGEYKLMGLAPYGRPSYVDTIKRNLIALHPDGSFTLNPEYFGFLDGLRMTNDRFERLFEGPPRKPEGKVTRREVDLAASVQKVLEEAVLGLARHARKLTEMKNLVMAGGVALNCVANGELLRHGIFDDLWIQPAAGDAGGALGAALFASHQHLGVPRKTPACDGIEQKGSLLGPSFSSGEVRAFLDSHDIPYQHVDSQVDRARWVAGALTEGKIVGLFSGRMEYGPRALGARSILGDPRRPDTQVLMNLKIKFRESFRPFAPTVLADRMKEYFEIDRDSPFMLIVAPVRAERRSKPGRILQEGEDLDLAAIARQARSDIPAVTHVDYSARVQSLRQAHHSQYYAILQAFEELTGCALVVNTSFNVRGEPIVCSPRDAYACFIRTNMDLLLLEDCLLSKRLQPPFEKREDPEESKLSNEPARRHAETESVQRFFAEQLVPVARQLRVRDLVALRRDPDGQEIGETGFVPHSSVPPAIEELDPDKFADVLRARWTAEGLEELAELAEPLMDLGRICRLAERESSDISPFMYVLF